MQAVFQNSGFHISRKKLFASLRTLFLWMSNFHDNQHKRSLKTDLKKFSNSKDWDSSHLTLSWRGPLSYRNQSIDLQSKSMDWFLYYNGLCHERVKSNCSSKNWFITHLSPVISWRKRLRYYFKVSVWYIKNYVEVIYVKSF